MKDEYDGSAAPDEITDDLLHVVMTLVLVENDELVWN